MDGATASSAAQLTGFAPRNWEWSRLTMNNSSATLSFPVADSYNLQLLMREDGLRVDKMLLITDTNYIPTGNGPTASDSELITNTVSSHLQTHTVAYDYDNLYRLKEAVYTGAITATYQYAYNAIGSRMAYTTTYPTGAGQGIDSTTVTTYTYDAANHLQTARADDTGVTWHYVYDGNGSRLRQIPGGLTATDGETRYSFSQAGQMNRIEKHDGSAYSTQADIGYDGMGNRVLGTTYIEGVPVTVTYTMDGSFGQPIVIASNASTTLILYGKYAIGEYKLNAAPAKAWQYYLGDGELSVRQLADSDGNIDLTRTYAPYGILLAKEGDGTALFGYAGGQAGVDGLWYFGDGYYDPQTGAFLAAAGEESPLTPLAAAALANPGGLLFGPLMLWSWRRKKKGGKLPPTGLFVLALLFTVGLVSCDTGDNTPPATENAPTLPPEIDPTQIPTSIPTQIPPATATNTAVDVTPTPCLDCAVDIETTTDSIPTVTPFDLDNLPKANQYELKITELYGFNACGLVAATTWFFAPGTDEYYDLIQAIWEKAGRKYNNDTGIQPEDYANALKGVFGEENVSSKSNWTIDELENELLKGNIVIVDILVGETSQHPEPLYPQDGELTIAHFARVLKIDNSQRIVYIENTLTNYLDSSWQVSFEHFEEVWRYPGDIVKCCGSPILGWRSLVDC